MLLFISFLVMMIGCANWLCIGLLQFDFVAGLFGSQSNIFSRIVYVIVGIASIITTYHLIKNKGKLTISFNKMKQDMKNPKQTLSMESSSDNSKSMETPKDNYRKQSYNEENAVDNSKSDQMESSYDNYKSNQSKKD